MKVGAGGKKDKGDGESRLDLYIYYTKTGANHYPHYSKCDHPVHEFPRNGGYKNSCSTFQEDSRNSGHFPTPHGYVLSRLWEAM